MLPAATPAQARCGLKQLRCAAKSTRHRSLSIGYSAVTRTPTNTTSSVELGEVLRTEACDAPGILRGIALFVAATRGRHPGGHVRVRKRGRGESRSRCVPRTRRLDITRSGAPPMLTLGGGFHYCVGVHLAKRELAEALSVMARRMPNIRRAGPAQWKPLLDWLPWSVCRLNSTRRSLSEDDLSERC